LKDASSISPQFIDVSAAIVTYRTELKYTGDLVAVGAALEWLHQSPEFFRQQYPQRQVNNVYFDTFDFDDATDNLIGLSDREKLRLRWYGREHRSGAAKIEYKMKRRSMGSKSMHALELPDLSSMDARSLSRYMLEHCQRSSRLRIDSRAFNPTVFLNYQREYFINRIQNVRFTVDTGIQFCRIRRLGRGVLGRAMQPMPYTVLEVKFDLEHAAHAARALAGFPLRADRHSKYLASLARLHSIPY
jgi:hypothetical protein